VLPVDIRLSAHTNKRASGRAPIPISERVPVPRHLRQADRRLDSLVKRCSTFPLPAWPVLLVASADRHRDRHQSSIPRGRCCSARSAPAVNNEVVDVFKCPLDVCGKMRTTGQDRRDQGAIRALPRRRFIRKTSIDELPQLFKRASRNLSLVGPRPHAVGSNTADKRGNRSSTAISPATRSSRASRAGPAVNGWRGEVEPRKAPRRCQHDSN